MEYKTEEVDTDVNSSDVVGLKPDDQSKPIVDDLESNDDDIQDIEALKEELQSLKEQNEHAQSFVNIQKSQIAKQKEQLKQMRPIESLPPEMPDVDDYEDNKSYKKAVKKWSEEMAEIKAKKLADQEQYERELNKKRERFIKETEKIEKEHPDYREKVFSSEMNMLYDNFAPFAAALVESENGAEIAYYLSKNFTNASIIANLPEHEMYRELGKIEENIKNIKQNKISKAKAPIKPIKGSSPTNLSKKKILDMTDAELWEASKNGTLRDIRS